MYSIKTIFEFITQDFEIFWNSIAEQKGDIPRGNYTFALKSMIFLEFISRICENDSTKLSNIAKHLDAKYFAKVPLSCPNPDVFNLPYLKESQRNNYLLTLLFVVIRHGTAHYYDPFILEPGEFYFDIGITGAKADHTLAYLKENYDKIAHLKYQVLDASAKEYSDLNLTKHCKLIKLVFNPALFYLDLKKAVKKSNLISGNLCSKPLEDIFDKNNKRSKYKCKSDKLLEAFNKAGINPI